MGCRKSSDKGDLIRIVRTPENRAVPDPSGKMNGRGAYLCRNRQCLERALKTGSLARSLKAAIPFETGEALKKEISE